MEIGRIRKKNFGLFILGFLVCLNIIAWLIIFDLQSHFLEVNFFDVGQGDAIFIETPQRHQILIDGGPSSAILEKKLAREMPFYDRSIDLIILSHPEKDHLVGLIEVLKRYQVDFIFWTGIVKDTFEWKEWQKLIEWQREKGTKLLIAQANQRIKLQGSDSCNLQGAATCIFMEILYPWENLAGKIFKNSNNTSIVAKLVFNQNSFLFTGDITKSEERKLVGSDADIDSDVLKVAHHGSKTSSAEEFIKKVLPEIAVISVGKNNRYNHPNQEILEVLQKYDIKVLRTDLNGDIKIISDGKILKIKNQNGMR